MKWLGVGEEPWLPSRQLAAIARSTGKFNRISVVHDKYVAERKQVFYLGVVEDREGRHYSRSGVAMIGEALPEMEAGEVADEEQLASSRALRSVLELAGFDPFSDGSVIEFAPDEPGSAGVSPASSEPIAITRTDGDKIAAEAASRASDLATIHIMAERLGLIYKSEAGRKIDKQYRDWLFANYGVNSVGEMHEAERASVKNSLLMMLDEAE